MVSPDIWLSDLLSCLCVVAIAWKSCRVLKQRVSVVLDVVRQGEGALSAIQPSARADGAAIEVDARADHTA